LPAPSAAPAVPGTRVPKTSSQTPGLVLEMRNHPVVAEPLGFADPFSVAVTVVTPVAEAVTTDGASAGAVKLMTAPKEVPTEFCAMAQA
jgi:hypothetical protein